MTPYNVTAAVISLFFVAVILLLVRRQRLGNRHTLWWLCTVAGMLAIGLFPSMADWVGTKLGVHYPPVLPIVLALCLIFVKILTMDIEWTRQESRIRILAQKMAAYEADIREIKAIRTGESSTEDEASL
ncbi:MULTISPECIES: DUF2304 domain-containing protein [unclassified Pseudodesulfovibrio]|uniref:DUF2304 domain-containing protein n=1 Tax=unclassified Pseudodesulfovibrio TaxID=2661612 RepID=UPI000FEBA695|nr:MULTISPECIES: DUF2304 domain-containing protein [unclassified Pseudodesulfovibrio]MCJ2164995.1 DUF2304 domain-containing protein [Pseudodesulfovibrio sp. S3-i]RWU03564.1 DUF2304 domain-containing protein [Pseudodesulfovibrio sp. S3]